MEFFSTQKIFAKHTSVIQQATIYLKNER